MAVGTDALNEYVNQRIDAGAKLATLNRELAALRGMFRLRLLLATTEGHETTEVPTP